MFHWHGGAYLKFHCYEGLLPNHLLFSLIFFKDCTLRFTGTGKWLFPAHSHFRFTSSTIYFSILGKSITLNSHLSSYWWHCISQVTNHIGYTYFIAKCSWIERQQYIVPTCEHWIDIKNEVPWITWITSPMWICVAEQWPMMSLVITHYQLLVLLVDK